MNRYFSLILIFIVCHIAFENNSAAHDEEYKAVAPILSSAENFFMSLKDGEYDAAWDLLSDNSRKVIIGDVYDAGRKLNKDINREDIIMDFNGRGRMFTNYWNSFRRSFDTDMVLKHSEWEMGRIGDDEAEIIIRHKTSGEPTILRMRKEEESWKVGLTETFWQRRTLNLLHLIFQ
ncbi:MAG: hypothetical protein HZC49_04750 [Nitrospirae bacterium]|nr:hypothetical protein [Nitrospirota bacterium]